MLGGKANRHEDLSRSLREITKRHVVTHLGLIAFRLLCHLWEPEGELCSAHSYTLILSLSPFACVPNTKAFEKAKSRLLPLAQLSFICGSQTYKTFHAPFRGKSGRCGRRFLAAQGASPAAIIVSI